MNTEYNLKILVRVIEEVFNQELYDVLPELLFEPEFIEHQFGLHPTIQGMAGDIQFLHKVFPDFKLTIEDMAANGDKVWGRMTARGTNLGRFMGPPNGKSFEITVMDEVRFKDGKIVERGFARPICPATSARATPQHATCVMPAHSGTPIQTTT